jgi:hypothetical protein
VTTTLTKPRRRFSNAFGQPDEHDVTRGTDGTVPALLRRTHISFIKPQPMEVGHAS